MTDSSQPSRRQLRQQYRSLRNALSQAQQVQASQRLAAQAFSLSEIQNAQNIAVYLANDGELDMYPFLSACRQQRKKLYLPVIHPFNKQYLLFVAYTEATQLNANRFGILEPALNSSAVCPIAQLDICMTPLVAFDNAGNRLGMGGGFYDRTFARLNECANLKMIGVAHDCQRAASLPAESWDLPLQTIVTPKHIYRFSS